MNVVDATTLQQITNISNNSNMLVWNQETGDMNRMRLSTLTGQIVGRIDLSSITNQVTENTDDIVDIKNDVSRIDTSIDDLSSRINAGQSHTGNVGTLTINSNGASILYDGTEDKTVYIPNSSGGSGSINITRVRFIDNIDGVDSSNLNQDLTNIIQGVIDELYSLGGGTIIFGSRKYCVTSLTLKSKVNLIGSGMGNTILYKIKGNTTHHCLIFVPASCMLNEIYDMTLTGSMARHDIYHDDGTPNFWLSDDVEDSDGLLFEGISTTFTSGADFFKRIYTDEPVPTTYPQNYKKTWVSHVAFMGFKRDGLHIEPEYDYSIYVDNCVAYANMRHGFYLFSSDDYFTNLHAEKNGRCGIFMVAGGCKFSGMKSIWNGFVEPDAKWSTQDDVKELIPDANQNNENVLREQLRIHSGYFKNYNALLICSRCSISNLEVQDGYCCGAFVEGDQFNISGLSIDLGGYRSLGFGATETAYTYGYYDGLCVVNCNYDFLQFNIYNYKRSKNCIGYKDALKVGWFEHGIMTGVLGHRCAQNCITPTAGTNNISSDSIVNVVRYV